MVEAQNLFSNSGVNITAEGKRHLGAVIRGTEYRNDYVKDSVKDWDNLLNTLSAIEEAQPQTPYSAFASGFKSKLNYSLRTILNIHHLLLPLERTIRNKFIPAVTGDHICNDKVGALVSLPTRYVVLGIPIFHETTETEFMNYSKIKSKISDLVYSTL